MISNFVVGGGAGEAGRLDGLRNEGVLIVCIAQVLAGCVEGVYGGWTVAESLKRKGGWTVSVYMV